MPLTGDSQVNKKAFRIAINSRKLARFYPLDREKTVYLHMSSSNHRGMRRRLRWRKRGQSGSLSEPISGSHQAERGQMLTARPHLNVSLIVSYLRKHPAFHRRSESTRCGAHCGADRSLPGPILSGNFRTSDMSAPFPAHASGL
jgi:hypothetical protein